MYIYIPLLRTISNISGWCVWWSGWCVGFRPILPVCVGGARWSCSQKNTIMPRITKKTKKKKSPNVAQVSNWSIVHQRLQRWKDGDIGAGTESNYIPKHKEFLKWAKANVPGILNSSRQQANIIHENNLSDERKHVAELNITKVISTGFSPFELFLASKVKENGGNYAKGYYGSYRSAFKKFFTWQKRVVPEDYDVSLTDIIKGIGRQETLDIKNGKKISTARLGISFAQYKQLCAYYMTRGDIKHWTMCVLEFNLMCRVNQINDLTAPRLRFSGDSLQIQFSGTKMDVDGSSATATFAKHLYGNPYDFSICPITALGVYLLFNKAEENYLFPGQYEDKVFTTAMKTAAKDLTWENSDMIGSHSLRKAAWSYSQSGTTACPSFAATCMRAEHSLGNVKDRYFVFAAVGGAQDGYLGRILAGLSPDQKTFSVLPPHFVKDEDVVLQSIRSVFDLSGTTPLFIAVLNKCLASIVYHAPKMKSILAPNHCIFQSILFRNPSMIPSLQLALNPDSFCSDVMTPTGIPPHIMVLREIMNMNTSVKDAIDKAFKEHSLAQPNVTRDWMNKTIGPLQDAVTSLTQLVRSRHRDTGENRGSILFDGNLRHGGQRIPTSYRLPKMKFKQGWSYWLFGDAENNIPPLQFVGTWELCKSDWGKFRNYRRLMRKVEKAVKASYPNINFKQDFKISPNMSAENIQMADKYFIVGEKIVHSTKRYKSQPVRSLGISAAIKRIFKRTPESSAPAVAMCAPAASSN